AAGQGQRGRSAGQAKKTTAIPGIDHDNSRGANAAIMPSAPLAWPNGAAALSGAALYNAGP
ncbi:hypothetical protein, partial [Bordetella hinzii]